MSGRTLKVPSTNAEQKRREYLQAKASAALLITVGSTIAGGSFVLLIMMSLVPAYQQYFTSSVDWSVLPVLNISLNSWPCFLIFVVTVLVFFGGLGMRRNALKEARRLVYVPPVAEQVAALPAEEILVRGSERPDAAPPELLRAAHSGNIEDANELLRAESGTM